MKTDMNMLQELTTMQPTPKEISNTPHNVRKYIKSLEQIIVKYIVND